MGLVFQAIISAKRQRRSYFARMAFGGVNIQIRDIHSLLEQTFSEGFTTDFLSKATGVSADLILRCYNGEAMSQDEIRSISRVLDFLAMLYMTNTNDICYLKDSVEALEQHYGFSHTAIANYLGMDEGDFDIFLEHPAAYPDGYKLSMKVMHFRSVLLQNQRK